ncbi:MAG: low molecular weight phosphotyrosine protein phosphatase [Cardiobacteriaceae bacterium]|nr:low molecular weight phosphotyrosine protein phosphatase [Cardiobacteriaceae bacterium]
MKKIIMLCTGNICRSPMAEGLLKKLAANRKDLIIDSAGCESFHTGENPDERAIETMQKHGIDISDLTARPLEFADVEPAENIIMAATKQHLIFAENKRLRCNGRAKIIKMLGQEDLPDPYYGGKDGFEYTYQKLEKALQQWLIDNPESK